MIVKNPTYNLELELRNKGYKYIIGIDEAGRGPLAGPVVAAAVNIPDGFDTSEINDSKKLSSKKRELLYNNIIEECDYAIAEVDEKMIDSINILNATKLAMRQVVYDMPKADFVLVDGNFVPELIDVSARSVINGDNISVSIAAASIIAKVHRDDQMLELHERYPIYGFDKHKGYGTKYHRDAIKLYGPSFCHRQTFRGVKEYI